MPNAPATPTIRISRAFARSRRQSRGGLAALALGGLALLACERAPQGAPSTPPTATGPAVEPAEPAKPATYDVRYATRGEYDVRLIVSGLDRSEFGTEGDTALDLRARVTTRPVDGGVGDRLPGRAMRIDWEVTEIHSQVVVGLRDPAEAVGARGVVVLDASGKLDPAATKRARADVGLDSEEGQGVQRDILADALRGAFAWPVLPDAPMRAGGSTTAQTSREMALDGLAMRFDGEMTYSLRDAASSDAPDNAKPDDGQSEAIYGAGEDDGGAETITVALAGVGKATPTESDRDAQLAMKSEGSVTLSVPDGRPHRIDVFEETQLVVDGQEMTSRWRVISTFTAVDEGRASP